MERVTMENVRERAANLNRRLEGTGRYVVVQGRNGYVALDEYGTVDGRENMCLRTLTVGTKREVADYLHAAMVGIDLSR